MRIGIIGPGKMGTGLARLWSAKGHDVMLGSRDASRGAEVAQPLGANVRGGSIADAAAFGDVLVLATPWGGARESIQAAGNLQGKVVVDVTNPLKADDSMALAVGGDSSGAEQVQQWAEGAHVVKAFNTVFQQILHAGPPSGPQLPAVFCCGDDAAAKETVLGLVREAGFDAVDAGPLQASRQVEPMAVLVIRLGYGQGLGTGTSFALYRG